MSKFSGKCDLYDHISMEKMYDSGNVKLSDEMECFEIFKQKTGGVIYQNVRLNLTDFNIDVEIKKKNNPDILSMIEHEEVVQDRRLKEGKKTKTTYSYIYYGKEYASLKDINKQGYWTIKEIKFNTILDLIPYYPYIVSSMSCSKGKETIVISNESYIDKLEQDELDYGHVISFVERSRALLQEHYLEVFLKYLNPIGREMTEVLPVVKEGKNYFITTSSPIDYNFRISVDKTEDNHDKPIMCMPPKVIDFEKGLIDVSKLWPYQMDDVKELKVVYIKKDMERKKYYD